MTFIPMNLLVAAALLVAISLGHSWLGERYVLIRLFRRQDLPPVRGSEVFTKQILRFAWHITSLAWLGFAAILVLLSRQPVRAEAVLRVISVTFLASALLSAFGSRGRHYSWIVFVAVALLTWFAP